MDDKVKDKTLNRDWFGGQNTKKLLKYTKNQGLMTSRAVSDDKEIIEKQKNENKTRKISENSSRKTQVLI